MMRSNQSEAGFSLIEIVVAIAVMVILTAAILPSIDQYISFAQGLETQAAIARIRKAMTQAYKDNAMLIDTCQGSLIYLNTGATDAFTTNDVVPINNPSSAETGYLDLAQYAGQAANKLAIDGYGRPWMVYVSNMLSAQYENWTIPYHVIAFVAVKDSGGPQSAEANGVSFNPNTGQLTLPPHAYAAVINGLPIEEKLYRQTMTNLQAVAQAYGTYFTTSYLANQQRSLGIDYFANADAYDQLNAGDWNSASSIGNSGNGNGPGFPYPGVTGSLLTNYNVEACDVQPAEDLSGFASALGLSNEMLTSAWGYPIGIGNGPNANTAGNVCYGSDRNPSSGNGGLQTPPFTAFVDAWAPGGVLMAVPVVGDY